MIRRPPRSTQSRSSAASDVYKRQTLEGPYRGREGKGHVSSDERDHAMRLSLINPSNPLVSIVRVKENRWNRYRVWKPLGLLVLAGLTPPEWQISIVDENLGAPDYAAMPRPDLVGITAFTSQANRAYEAVSYTHLRAHETRH